MERRSFVQITGSASLNLCFSGLFNVLLDPNRRFNPKIIKWLLKLAETLATEIIKTSLSEYIKQKFFKEEIEEDLKNIRTTFNIDKLTYYNQRNYIVQYGKDQSNFFFPVTLNPKRKKEHLIGEDYISFFNNQSFHKGLSMVLDCPAFIGLTSFAEDLRRKDLPTSRICDLLLPVNPNTTNRRQGFGFAIETNNCIYDTLGGTVSIQYKVEKDYIKGTCEFARHSGMPYPEHITYSFENQY